MRGLNKRNIAVGATGTLIATLGGYFVDQGANAAPTSAAVSCELPQGLRPGTVNWLAGGILKIYNELPDNQRAEKDTPATRTELATQTKGVSVGSIATSEAVVSYRVPKTSNGQPTCVGLLQSVSISNVEGNDATLDTFTPDIPNLRWRDSEMSYKDGKLVGVKDYYSTGADAPVFNQMLTNAQDGFQAAVATDPILAAVSFLTAGM